MTMHRLRWGDLLLLIAALWAAGLHAEEAVRFAGALQPYVDRHELAGAVMLVADKDRVLSVEAVGWKDVGAQQAMTTDALFWIASQTKPITAAAVMTLVDEGRISLDDPITNYLPEFKPQMVQVEADDEHRLHRRPATAITVRNVLSHMSGMPFKSALEEPTLDLYPLSARTRSYAMTPLENEPGTHYRYSNAGINTAARIIEVVAAQPFEEFLDQRLLQPLGMRDTTFWPNAEQVARLAKAYQPTADKQNIQETQIVQLYYPLTDRRERYPMPAGGLFSTASDVVKFYQMLLNDGQFEGRRILSAAAVKELTRRQTPQDVKESYGLGFQVGPDTFGHGGAYSTNTTAHRDRGLITVWLVQHAGFIGEGAKCQELFREQALKPTASK